MSQKEYVSFEVYQCPNKPNKCGKYVSKTPIYEQAKNACMLAEKRGKSYFIKGVKADGTKVTFL